MRLDWRGDQVRAKIQQATTRGIDKTMAQCVGQAKQNHPGWKNRTGTAEGSVRIIQFAEQRGSRIAGRWGSMGVEYVLRLELRHGSFLRTAADVVYPRLPGHIKEAM